MSVQISKNINIDLTDKVKSGLHSHKQLQVLRFSMASSRFTLIVGGFQYQKAEAKSSSLPSYLSIYQEKAQYVHVNQKILRYCLPLLPHEESFLFLWLQNLLPMQVQAWAVIMLTENMDCVSVCDSNVHTRYLRLRL